MKRFFSRAGLARRVPAIAGILIIFGSISAALFIWLLLVPLLRGTGPPEFSPRYSSLGLWEISQAGLKLGLWTHDHGFIVGDFGGKEWVEDLVASMVSGKGIGCAGGHREAALEGITNHSPPEGADLGDFWSQWWSQAQGLSQEEWIRAGFESDGIALSLPPRDEDWPALLRVLGEPREGAAVESEWGLDSRYFHPRRSRYNAYRWLRDSGFDPVDYALEGGDALGADQRSGLLAYREFEKEFSAAVPGRLDLSPSDDQEDLRFLARPLPRILDPAVQANLAILLAAALLIGAVLVAWGCRRRLPEC